jgi:hypothetical protein
VEVVKVKLKAPLEEDRIGDIVNPNVYVDRREQERGGEVMRSGDELDEGGMVDVDVNSAHDETERTRELDSEVHRALLQASSEVTLPTAGDEAEVEPELKMELEEKRLGEVD